jgi:hypothetical protein
MPIHKKNGHREDVKCGEKKKNNMHGYHFSKLSGAEP